MNSCMLTLFITEVLPIEIDPVQPLKGLKVLLCCSSVKYLVPYFNIKDNHNAFYLMDYESLFSFIILSFLK